MHDHLKDLLPWATERQAEYINATITLGTMKAAGEHLGVNPTSVTKAIKRVQARAAVKGWSPDHDMTHTVPEGFAVKGTSTYYDGDGNMRGQWVKTKADDEARLRIMKDVISAMCEEIEPLPPQLPPGS